MSHNLTNFSFRLAGHGPATATGRKNASRENLEVGQTTTSRVITPATAMAHNDIYFTVL